MADMHTGTLTQTLASLILNRGIGPRDLESAAYFTLDAVANVLAGQQSDPGRRVLAWFGKDSARFGDPGRLAFVMGALAHSLETDDLHRASVVHPGCVVIPAAWASALSVGADGPAFLKAVIHGFEAATRIGMSVGPSHYKVWHNTATCGPFGAAAAAGSLLGLDSTALAHAFGNAGTQSSGLWEFLDSGGMSKHLHAGRAAESGWMAASLARHGFTGPSAILEGPRGFYAGTCADPDPDQVLPHPDAPWQVHETSIKPWPCCRHTHPAIDAAEEIRAGFPSNGEIDRVLVETYTAAIDVCDRPQPETAYAAKFSLQHCVAAALAFDRVDFDAFEPEARALLSRARSTVTLKAVPRFSDAYPHAWGSTVTVYLSDGRQLSASRTEAKGDPQAPLSREDLIKKARMLMSFGGIDRPEPLINALLDLPRAAALPDLPGLTLHG